MRANEPVPIPVRGFPIRKGYDTPEEAIWAARNDPRMPRARADARRLSGARLVEGRWWERDVALRFDNGLWLRVFVADRSVSWSLRDAPPDPGTEACGYGAPPVLLAWGGDVGTSAMDVSALLACRRNGEFADLWANGDGVMVLLRGHLWLCFHGVDRLDSGTEMLYVCEDD